jgi:ribulose-5-phosphate 4-epimerase/fuculose-1-phosphate aldolase
MRNRSDVNVVVHSHPFHACVFSAASEPLTPFTLAADYFIDVPRHQDEVALITTRDEGQAMARAMGQGFAVFLANHGVTFCGTSVAHAVCVGVFLEQACKAQLAGMSAGIGSVELARPIREKRRSQIMTPVHWDHSWNYFRRKLKAHEGASGPRPVYG